MAKHRKRHMGGDVGAALSAMNITKVPGGFKGFIKDATTIAVGVGVGTGAALGASALMSKTPVGGMLGNLQGPVLLAAALGGGPVVGLAHPVAGLGFGIGVGAVALYAMLAKPLGLPVLVDQSAAPPAAAATNGLGAVFGDANSGGVNHAAFFGGARPSLGIPPNVRQTNGLGQVAATVNQGPLTQFGGGVAGPRLASVVSGIGA